MDKTTDTLTFIADDKLIIYNDKALWSATFKNVNTSEGIVKAIHWSPSDKHVEFVDTYRELKDSDFDTWVLPYIMLFTAEEAEVARKEQEQNNDPEWCASLIRTMRNSLLNSTDYLLMQDYPITDADKKAIEQYRKELRDITEDPSFPWTGTPVENIPWPKNPLAK